MLKNGFEHTVGDKFLGLLSTAIDKAFGGMLKGEEAHLKYSPEYAEGATIDLTLLQKAEKAISDKTATEKAESENVVAESVSAQQVSIEKVMVEKTAEEKVTIAKSTVANVAVEEVAAKTNYAYEHDDGAAGCTKVGRDRRGTSQIKLMSSCIQQPEASYAAHTRQSGQIDGMLEQMLSRIQSDT